jgi:DNA-binding NtrC family response regulator
MNDEKLEILLVESVEIHRESMRRAFQSQNGRFELKVVTSLREAKAYLANSTPALVIADLLLTDGRGTELLPLDNEPPRFPVVMISGQDGEREGVDIIKKGALDYVVKSQENLKCMPYAAERALREWHHLTELRQVEEALRLERDNLTNILDTMEDGVYVVNEKNEIQYLNPAIKKEFGVMIIFTTEKTNASGVKMKKCSRGKPFDGNGFPTRLGRPMTLLTHP